MKAIRTKYIGPTDFRGARIAAQDDEGNRVVIPRNHALSIEDNHRAAAETLIAKMGWPDYIVGGSYGNYYFWVFVD